MSIAGYPMNHGEEDDDGRATPAGEPPTNWDAQFTAIVSGISGGMRWEATEKDLDAAAQEAADRPVTRAPADIWSTALPDSPEDRRLRREIRRAERAEELAAFQAAQEELAAARAADTEHYEPPPPPPIPAPTPRTAGALVLIVVGFLLVIAPSIVTSILPARFELIAVGGVVMLFGGGWLLLSRLRQHRGPDDGAQV